MKKIDKINNELKIVSEELNNKYNEFMKKAEDELKPLYLRLRKLQDERIQLLNNESE